MAASTASKIDFCEQTVGFGGLGLLAMLMVLAAAAEVATLVVAPVILFCTFC